MSSDAEHSDDDRSTGGTPTPPSSPPPPPPAPSSVPRLPDRVSDSPAIAARPIGGPAIPPLETTAPTDFLHAESSESVADGSDRRSGDEFSPLRSDPPPPLISTWWLRTAILMMMLGALVLTLGVEYTGEADDIATHPMVLGLHLIIAGSIVLWSFAAMHNANKMVPPSLYRRRSSPLLAVVLWLAALGAPFAAAKAFVVINEQSASPDFVADTTNESVSVLALAAVMLVAFVVVWLPFRYHARQATRIGAPRRVMFGWFFAPLFAVVGGIAIVALGLQDQLAADGLTASERTIQVGVVYGLAMFVLALTTWRAITVFDEVLDLRWRRWKVEWEQTLEDFVRQPAPGPEGSPDTRFLEY